MSTGQYLWSKLWPMDLCNEYGIFIRTLIFFVFILLPVIFLLCSIYLVIAPIIQDPRIEFLYAFLFIVGGLLLYFPLVYFKLHKEYFDPITTFLQLLLEVATTSAAEIFVHAEVLKYTCFEEDLGIEESI